MFLRDILKGVKHNITGGSPDIDIEDVTDNSRAVITGGLFVAMAGHANDGRKFLHEAVAKGARAIVSDPGLLVPENVVKVSVPDVREALSSIAANFYGHPSEELKLSGITGTNGKTTVTYLMESIARAAGYKTGVIGTINYRIGQKTSPAKNTTPGALELQFLLRQMVGAKVRYVAMEVSSHALDQGRVSGVGFDAGIFTNITSDHLDYHDNKEKYFTAKARLYTHMKQSGWAVLNYDDVKVRSLKESIGSKTITYGTIRGSDVMGRNIKLSSDGSSFDVDTPSGALKIDTRLIGMYNVSNCLAAIAAMRVLGIDDKAVIEGIRAMDIVPGRLEPVDRKWPFKVLVDYAHTEDALNNVLSALKGISEGRILTVFGCGGDRDKTKRPLMGRSACRYSDHVIITSDNPRSEEPLGIIRDIESGVSGKFSNYEIEPDRREAIRKAVALARRGDVVLIAGKGHEDYQIIGDRKTHFDDREAAREAMMELPTKVGA